MSHTAKRNHVKISEKGLSRAHNVKLTNYPGGTSDETVKKLDDLIKDKTDHLVIHIRPNNLTNNVKLFDQCQGNLEKRIRKCTVNKSSVFFHYC